MEQSTKISRHLSPSEFNGPRAMSTADISIFVPAINYYPNTKLISRNLKMNHNFKTTFQQEGLRFFVISISPSR
jgi:hypothetical protein